MATKSNSLTVSRKVRSCPIRLGGKIVAVLRGMLLDVRRHEDGLLSTPPALALALDVLNQAEAFGARDLQLTIMDSGERFRISLSTFREHSFPLQREDFEAQRACPLSFFVVDWPSKALLAQASKRADSQQPALFDWRPR